VIASTAGIEASAKMMSVVSIRISAAPERGHLA
jgi:hypothetical protein